jgi:hypothetical protein
VRSAWRLVGWLAAETGVLKRAVLFLFSGENWGPGRAISFLFFGETVAPKRAVLFLLFGETAALRKSVSFLLFVQPSSGLAMLTISGGAGCGVTSKAGVHS